MLWCLYHMFTVSIRCSNVQIFRPEKTPEMPDFTAKMHLACHVSRRMSDRVRQR